MRKKKTSSILRKFLVFNLTVFSILGLFTIIYLEAIQPNLVNKRVSNHNIIIKNTTDHLERLNVKLNKEEINKFLLSTGFIFQGLDRVQFFLRCCSVVVIHIYVFCHTKWRVSFMCCFIAARVPCDMFDSWVRWERGQVEI